MAGSDSAEPAGFPDGVQFLHESEILDWTVRLRSGERGKAADGLARRILTDFTLRQTFQQAHSPAALEWLAEALSSTLDGADPRHELGLMRPPAVRPSTPKRWHDIAIWLAATERLGHSPAQAAELAAAKFHKDVKTVEAYRRRAAKAGLKLLASKGVLAEYFGEVRKRRPTRDERAANRVGRARRDK